MSTSELGQPERGSPLHYVALVLLSLICLVPIAILALTSVKTQAQIFDVRWSWLFMPTMDNYRAVIEDGHIDRYLLNSVIISVASTVLTLTLGSLCAYGLARFRFRHCSRVFRSIAISGACWPS